MIKKLLDLASWLVIGTLLIFTLRRWLFAIFALLPPRPGPKMIEVPEVLLLTPIRNEAPTLPALLSALDQLIYPADRLTVVLIDDGSTDNSRQIIQQWVNSRQNWFALVLDQNIGKANALNAALAQFSQGEIIAVYDADERPRPEALQRLANHFAVDWVGGVSGRRAVSNALASPAASYTAYEGLVHQLVTMRAKDRLKLAPALLGANCAYRRTALAEAGNFKPGALLEDSDLTVKLAQAGWQVRFEPEAISYHHAPQSVGGYWRQHTRWARGFNEVAKDQAAAILLDSRLSSALRLELFIFSVGYLDRAALLGGAALAMLHKRARQPLLMTILVSLLTPVFQIIIALQAGREPLAMWRRLMWLPLFFGLDVAMAAAGLWTTLSRTPQIWEERQLRQ